MYESCGNSEYIGTDKTCKVSQEDLRVVFTNITEVEHRQTRSQPYKKYKVQAAEEEELRQRTWLAPGL